METPRHTVEMVRQLFSKYVPEVQQHTVEIKAVAHEPGAVLYVAVHATHPNINPVSICCKPPRPAQIRSELGEDLLSLILWSSSVQEFIVNSLLVSPRLANLRRQTPAVFFDPIARSAIVRADKLTIQDLESDGGLRVRLASNLVGWILRLEAPE